MTKVTISIESEWDWLLNVTCNDISVIYMTTHRRTGGLKKKLNLRSGSQRQRHFVGFSLQAPIRAILFTVISRNRPIYSSFTTRLGYGGPILILTPPPPGVPTERLFHFAYYKLSFPEYQYSSFFWIWRFYFPVHMRCQSWLLYHVWLFYSKAMSLFNNLLTRICDETLRVVAWEV